MSEIVLVFPARKRRYMDGVAVRDPVRSWAQPMI